MYSLSRTKLYVVFVVNNTAYDHGNFNTAVAADSFNQQHPFIYAHLAYRRVQANFIKYSKKVWNYSFTFIQYLTVYYP